MGAEEADITPPGVSSSSSSRWPDTASLSSDGSTQALTILLAFSSALLAAGPAASEDNGKIDAFFNFNPVCPASDGIFRFGQKGALLIAGDENIENYRPLINDVLIRVRTELCVLESFIRETATPFIQTKGLGWVLPLHETSETFLAGAELPPPMPWPPYPSSPPPPPLPLPPIPPPLTCPYIPHVAITKLCSSLFPPFTLHHSACMNPLPPLPPLPPPNCPSSFPLLPCILLQA